MAGLLILSVGVILAATLTPGREALEHASDIGGRCDLGRLTPASPREYLRFGSAGLNVLLFMPLGFVVALLPRSRRTAGIAIAAIALPFTVEAVQLLATFLGRACQSADVVDNLLGLAGGAVLGAAAVITGLISGHREIGAGRRHSGQ